MICVCDRINGGLHAREWITISSAMYLIHSLINDYQKNDAQAKKLLDELEFVIVPVGNPDGYEFSRNSSSPDNRMVGCRFSLLKSFI